MFSENVTRSCKALKICSSALLHHRLSGGIMLEPLGHIYDPTTDKSGSNPRFYNGDIVKGHLRPPVDSQDLKHLAELSATGSITYVHTPYRKNGALHSASIRPTYTISTDVVVSGAELKNREHPIFAVDEHEYGDTYITHRVDRNVPEEYLTLVRRGNYWNHFHGEPLHFNTTREEGRFWLALGHVTYVRKPRFSRGWTRQNAIRALLRGTIDTFVRADGTYEAYRYVDFDVGDRVREDTIRLLNRWAHE